MESMLAMVGSEQPRVARAVRAIVQDIVGLKETRWMARQLYDEAEMLAPSCGSSKNLSRPRKESTTHHPLPHSIIYAWY